MEDTFPSRTGWKWPRFGRNRMPDDSSPRCGPQSHHQPQQQTIRRRIPPPPFKSEHEQAQATTALGQPSIPTSINPTMNLSGILASFPDNGESSPQTSVTSELTFMTYSDERAQILKERFIRRIRHEQVTRELSLAERKAILQELQEEQQAEQQKERWKSATAKRDSEEHRRNISHPYEEEEKSCSAEVTEVEDEIMETKSNGSGYGRRRSISFSSYATAKRRNSKHDCYDDDEELSNSKEDQEETNSPSLIPEELECNQQASPNNWTQQASAEADIENIAEIIKLKLLVANQQAAMDTLSSKLHNMELASRQQQNMDQSRIHSLEAENQSLAELLNEFEDRGDLCFG